MDLFSYIAGKSTFAWAVIGVTLVVCIGFVDYWLGYEFAFSLVYFIPIFLVTWFAGRIPGLAICFMSAFAWFAADTLSGHIYSHPFISYWNVMIRLGVFIVVALLLSSLKEMENEKKFARCDYLTGAANRRHFFEVAQRELAHSQKYNNPLTVAYVDLDDFKTVNDRLTHSAGDSLLCAVVEQAKKHLRKTDIIARVGGDEFILLFPESDLDNSQTVISRIQSALLEEMRRNNWPVTFSIGVLICRNSQLTIDELIRKADEVMYSVKKKGKNGIAYIVYES